MAYHYTLPAQRSPYTCRPREISLRSQTVSEAMARSPGHKRTSLYANDSSNPKDASPHHHQPWFEHANKENVKITTHPATSKTVLDEDSCQYDPADPTTWGIKPLPPLPRGGSNPLKASSIMSKSDDDATLLQSPVLSPYVENAEAPNNLAKLIGDHLRIEDEHPDDAHRRTTSSSYHCPESEPSRVQSPIPNGNVNTLSVSNLAKYGKTNDRLSNLRSGSPSSATGELTMHEDADLQDDSSSVNNG